MTTMLTSNGDDDNNDVDNDSDDNNDVDTDNGVDFRSDQKIMVFFIFEILKFRKFLKNLKF